MLFSRWSSHGSRGEPLKFDNFSKIHVAISASVNQLLVVLTLFYAESSLFLSESFDLSFDISREMAFNT